MHHLKTGILISVEGIDGSGKSTLAASLHTQLTAQGLPTILTREPGATPLGAQLRTIVQEKKVPVCAKAEYLLFAADRAQHMHQLVLPALAEQRLVISDRMADSSLVYQGYGRGLELNMIQMINRWAMNERQPDLTVYVRVDAQTAMDRILARNQALTSFEKERQDFIEKLIAGFDTIFKTRTNCIIIDGTQPQNKVLETSLDSINQWLTLHNLIQ